MIRAITAICGYLALYLIWGIKEAYCYHFAVGFIISIGFDYLGLKNKIGFVFLIATAKEVFDYFRHGHPDSIDIFWTIIGAII